jgi:FHS family L-fucose permease-like MFS transporter
VLGPLIALYIYNSTSEVEGEKFFSTILPMLVIGLLVLTVAFVFMRLKLPEISEEDEVHAHGFVETATDDKPSFHIPLKKQSHFVLGVIAQFSYVAAQTGIFSYLINFVTDEGQYPRFDVKLAPYFLSIGFALFMIGRMSGSYLMSLVKPTKLLAICALLAALILPLVSMKLGWVSLISLYTVFFVMSIMFPTIFALAIKDLGPQTKKASSFLVMAIVGGAVFPPLMGLIADNFGMSIGFLAPIPFFAFIAYYAISGHKVNS